MTTSSAPETVAIPASHLDLLTRPVCGVLTTMGGDGQPQSSLVWVDWDGVRARVNTTLERHKGRNLVADPKVSLLVVDPDDPAATSRSAATPSWCPTAPWSTRQADAQVHPPPGLLRPHLPGRTTLARDPGDLPDPCPADHPGRDPRPSRTQ
jgi:PPOX class probable F420-dependent enzyme